MAAIVYPLVNGVAYSFANVELNCNGQLFTAFQSVNYSHKRARDFIRGNHPDPLSKTMGEITYEADFEVELAEFQMFILQLGSGWGDLFFQTQVSYNNPAMNVALGNQIIQDTILGCTMDEVMAQLKVGPNGIFRKITLHPLKILYNGVDLLAVPLTGLQSSALGAAQTGAASGSLAQSNNTSL